MAYLTGFVLEKSLSVDNIFVFVLIFSHFKVPREYQHRVLLWGVVGALAMRAGMIFAGAALTHRFEWVLYVFGLVVIASGLRILLQGEKPPNLEDNRILKIPAQAPAGYARISRPPVFRYTTGRASRDAAARLPGADRVN